MLDYETLQIMEEEDAFISEVYVQGYDAVIDDSQFGYITLIDSKNDYKKKVNYGEWMDKASKCRLIYTTIHSKLDLKWKTLARVSCKTEERRKALNEFRELIKKEVE